MIANDFTVGAIFFGYLLIFLAGRYFKRKAENLDITRFNNEMSATYILYTWVTGYWWLVFFITN